MAGHISTATSAEYCTGVILKPSVSLMKMATPICCRRLIRCPGRPYIGCLRLLITSPPKPECWSNPCARARRQTCALDLDQGPAAIGLIVASNVRLWPEADTRSSKPYFRLVARRRLKIDAALCPLVTRSGHRRRSPVYPPRQPNPRLDASC